jgi:hypothetical protein
MIMHFSNEQEFEMQSNQAFHQNLIFHPKIKICIGDIFDVEITQVKQSSILTVFFDPTSTTA